MPLDQPAYHSAATILESFTRVRAASEALARPLSPEDCMLQSMEAASPVKWNLAHTSWFFETFILQPHAAGYRSYHPEFGFLFNSYYNQIGEMHPRPIRGLVSRPSLEDVYSYRAHVNEALTAFLEKADEDALAAVTGLVTLGCAHEEQHQELLVTDLQHAMSYNALKPVVYEDAAADIRHAAPAMTWRRMEGGVCDIGWPGGGFAFDNEGPRHKTYLHPFELANRPVTNVEYLEFMEDGGYDTPDHWLSDGWDMVQREGWRAPLYWRKADGEWRRYSLFGEREIDPHAPVCHVSHYEAAAYASWAGARLPTEFEWEAAASLFPVEGRFMEAGAPRSPAAAPQPQDNELLQLFGDVWEWTASAYLPYPGFAVADGAVGEYNGKFMSGQMVLKGGSAATPADHIRVSYRNFFPPDARWQFSGFRLARDIS
ncbi:ergothioneine biosynthesis protein EgtB [Hyphococcus luteus]|uniref:Ergothioneine biosynthesis protein EgtB n=1 Tax=Hyphococcus luteus TaxID=2058213 RepID=A0A2S7K0Z3_9PROT|nr:ergothioneine biosynthesis protein EgtB [Marinicaulis flavus]PQA86183.1 ergothioneine biosynthesis protein EgtB [Marinicaulis flavus]